VSRITESPRRGRGGPPALRGFRLQMLYVLHRLLTDPQIHAVMLETTEDAAFIDSNDRPTEVVQVKSEQVPLTAATLRDTTIIRRALSSSAEAQQLVSYSGFGTTLARAREGDQKAREEVAIVLAPVLGETSLAALFSRLTLTTVDEHSLTTELRALLTNTISVTHPETTIELLSHWLALQSEMRATVTRTQAIERVVRVGQYIENRRAVETEWFRTIEPVDATPFPSRDEQRLRNEYCAGISARRDHIRINADVARPEKIAQLTELFGVTETVVIHGASGQGKSTLALRYMEDYAPTAARFAVHNVRSEEQAVRVGRALAAHAEALGTPIFVHVDVNRSDEVWIKLVEELAHSPAIWTLVTVREEDWRRSGDLLSRVDLRNIALTLGDEEARNIFEMLQERRLARFPTFEDAWSSFEKGGPLLEFTYLVTQHERLSSRLNAQLVRLMSEFNEDQIVFAQTIMSIAECGARLSLKRLAASLPLANASSTVSRLADEYMIRHVDNDLIEGLHPIRSHIISRILTDSSLRPWSRTLGPALIAVAEDDLEELLLHAHSAHAEDSAEIGAALSQKEISAWKGLGGALRAQLWLGLKKHMEEYQALLDEAEQTFLLFGVGMFMGASHGKPRQVQQMIDALRIINPPLAIQAEAFAPRLPTAIAFTDAKNFICQLRLIPPEPRSSDPDEWLALAEFLYWINTLGVAPDCSAHINLDGLSALPSLVSSQCYLATHIIGGFKDEEQRMALQTILICRFVDEYSVLHLDYSSDVVTADYILPEEVSSGFGKAGLSETLLRIEILRCLLPEKSRFHVRGRNQLRLSDIDDSDRNLEAATIEYPWQRRWSRTLTNVVSYRLRPPDWPAYVETIISKCDVAARGIRWTIEAACSHLTANLSIPFSSPLGSYVNTLRADLMLPKSAVDPFGRTLVTDGSRLDGNALDSVSLGTHREFEMAADKYFSETASFLQNAELGLFSVAATARRSKSAKMAFEKLIPASKTDLAARGVLELSALHDGFMTLLDAHFGRMIVTDSSRTLSQQELADARDVWQLLALQPHAVYRSAPEVISAAQRLSRAWMSKRMHELQMRLDQRLSSNVTAVLHDETDSLHAVVIVIHCQNSLCVDAAIRATVDCTSEIWRGQGRPGRLAQMIYAGTWKHVIFVPCVRGRALVSATRQLSSLSLAFTIRTVFAYGIPRELDRSSVKRLGLTAWEIETTNPLLARIAQSVFMARVLSARVEDVWSIDRYYSSTMDSYNAKQNARLNDIASELGESLASLRCRGYRGQELVSLELWARNVAQHDLSQNLEALQQTLPLADRLVETLLEELTADPTLAVSRSDAVAPTSL
jgi:hypothetical protein